jgi:hypothetical protein
VEGTEGKGDYSIKSLQHPRFFIFLILRFAGGLPALLEIYVPEEGLRLHKENLGVVVP